MKFDFSVSAAKIVAQVRIRTCINKIDAEVLEDILKDELIKYHNEIFTYGHSIGYDDGKAYGYSSGHSAGYSVGHYEGYDDGYYDGRY